MFYNGLKTPWSLKKSLPKPLDIYGTIFITKQNAMIFFDLKNRDFLIYNVLKDEWELDKRFVAGNIFKADTTTYLDAQSVTVDAENEELYVLHEGTNTDNIVRIKISLNSDFTFNSIRQFDDSFLEDKQFRNAIVINRQYHIFTMDDNEPWDIKHFILNTQTNKLDRIISFKFKKTANSGLIYIKQKHELWLIGGDATEFSDASSDVGSTEFSDCIYAFSIKIKQWNKLNITLPMQMSYPSCVLTNDQKHIIILGGLKSGGFAVEIITDIYVLNLETMIIKKCNISCPINVIYTAVLSGNRYHTDLIIKGYSRCNYNKYVAPDIIKIIQSFYVYVYEDIHLFQKSGCYKKRHWTLPVNTILKNIS